MLRSISRIIFVVAVTLALTFGVFAVAKPAYAASSQPVAASGFNPQASVPTGIGYCYPSGYNRNGWRCGWRLAMAPYNLGSYYNYYGYYGYYGNYYNSGYGGQGYYYPYGYPYGFNGDYGGRPRFGGYYYNTCPYYNGGYCY